MNNDPYDTGIPKYTTASDIYESLQKLVKSEEMCILSEIFQDVSYDGQDYYYTDKGYTLLPRFEELTDYGNKLWLIDMAIWQLDENEIYDVIWDALHNPELARRLHFKKLIVDEVLSGQKKGYDDFVEDFTSEMGEFNHFSSHEVRQAFGRVMKERGQESYLYVPRYHSFIHALIQNARNLRLHEEKLIVTECRALLSSYDDFLLGLKINQTLYNTQEEQLKNKMASLQASYENKLKLLYLIAEKQGIILDVKQLRDSGLIFLDE